jgi:intracellular multiplication protein IcmQ
MTNNIISELEQLQTRQHLLAHLRAEKHHIVAAIEKFYAQNSRDDAHNLQALEEMISAFDRVLNAGDWESSLFLRNTVKPLKDMRQEAWQLREQILGITHHQAVIEPELAPGMIKVYIGIFQNKAHNLRDWEHQLNALPQYILGRPIYREETAIKQAIRAKLMQTSDAYVCVGVSETAIQTGEYHPLRVDKQGNELLQLIPGSVRSENILEFVYQDKHYYFMEGKLIEKTKQV